MTIPDHKKMSFQDFTHQYLPKLKNHEAISQFIERNKISAEEIYASLPCFLDIYFYKNDNDNYSPILEIDNDRNIFKSFINKKNYKKNIISQPISRIDVSMDAKEVFQKMGKVMKPIISRLKANINHQCHKGIYLFGPSGSSKTLIFKAITIVLSARNAIKVAFINTADLLSFYRKFEKANDKLPLFIWIKKLKNVDFLLIDDIGGEAIVESFRDEVLSPILRYRRENNKTTYFSSIYSWDELVKVESKSAYNKNEEKAKRIVNSIKLSTYQVKLAI